ncbi:MAG: SpoIIE family protein phosphatase [Deltaproteobacteria bacterium]|nr:SpoIIE family protein phosphatase [Deltaproteobacteria bacterium]
MVINRGIALKLTLLILTSVTLIFIVIFGYNYIVSRQIIIKTAEENARNLARATVNRIDTVLRSVEKIPQNLASFMEYFFYEGGQIIDLVGSVVENNPEIYGSTIAFEPYSYDKNALFFAPYYYRNKDKIEFAYIPYEYFYWDWYQIPKQLDRPTWSEPYFDEGAGNIIMSTYSVPFYRTMLGKRQMMGIVTADISLSWLQEIIASIKIARTGYGFLISKNGTFVTHPDSGIIMNETIFSVAEALGNTEMRELGREMIKGKSGFVPFTSFAAGEKCWMVYAPLPSTGWTFAALFPQDELMEDITHLNHIVLSLGIAGFIFLLSVIIVIAGSITRPLRALSKASEVIATGNLDVELPVINTRDEVRKLADSFSYMKTSLNQYIKELTETTAARERIESELQIARDIQMGILPKVFPPFPSRTEFDIYAVLEPAKEVGGDLYDFFFLDNENLCIAVGDVSGKGVPASLFMAITMTLIKAKATRDLPIGEVLSMVNDNLSQDNPSLMFVTLFFSIFNIRTGELEYCNGGHNPPYLIRSNGNIEPLESTSGIALGVMEDFTYESRKIVLQKGDTVFLYTDGVTEAMNERDELFSEQRLEKEIARLREKPLKEITSGLMEEISTFCSGTTQTDDITMMILKFFGK